MTTHPKRHPSKPITFVDLNYASFYFRDYDKAVAFYTRVLGPPERSGDVGDDGLLTGWRLGGTWLTLFPRGGTRPDANPANAEFAIRVAAPDEVDVLYRTFLEAGATSCRPPEDTRMYEPMRFGCVDDPFGVRVDVYCPLG